MFWFTLLLWTATFVASQLLTPDPDIENARPATLDDFNFPTATEGRVLPLVWGTDKIKGPNVIWYGDLDIVPIEEKVKVSMFNSKTFIKGFRYYVSFQMGFCYGPAALRKIWVGDELVWSGNKTTDGDISIDSKFAKGTFTFYTGTTTQGRDSYLQTQQSPCPAYRGMCYGIAKNMYVGESTSIKPWAVEITRIPNGLGLAGGGAVNTYDANLMNVAHEIQTNDDWGYGYPSADLDETTLTTHANILATEGNGFSLVLANPQQARSLIEMIEKQADCKFRLDQGTGKFTAALIRDGYSTSGLKVADNSSVLKVEEYSRGAWEGTINNVRVQFRRRSNDYTEGYAPAQDMANMQAQGRKVSATYNFPAVRDDALANSLAWREIRANSYPLAKAKLKVNRTFWNSYIGEPILFDYTCSEFTVTDLPMRIIKIDYGTPTEPGMTIDVVQDVFSYASPSFSTPDASDWVIPPSSLIPFPSDEQVVFEVPYAISRREEYVAENKLWCGAASQGREEAGAYIRQRNDTTDPSSGPFFDAGIMTGFIYVGTLVSDIEPGASTIQVTTGMNVSEILDVGDFEVGNDLTNLVLVGDEFIACQTASAIAGGVQLNNCYRGLMDSAERVHATGEDVYFLLGRGSITDTAFPLGNHVDIRLLPYRDGDQSTISETDPGLTEVEIDTDYRERRPYPPTNLELNGTEYPTSTVELDTQSTGGSTEDTKGVEVEFNRRDWRIYDEVSQLDTDAEDINSDFPTNNTTQYRLRVYDDPGGSPTLLFTIDYATVTKTGAILASRTKILRHNAGVIPSTMRFSVGTRHTDEYSTLRTALQDLYYDVDTQSTDLENDNNWGVITSADTYTSNWTAPDTGTYAFTLGTSGPSVWASVNDGAEQQIISAGNTTGNLTGVTASDTIKVKYKGTVTGDETIVIVASPTSTEDSYVIFV